MYCQRQVAQQVVEQASDYELALKGNQGSLNDDVRLLLEDPATIVGEADTVSKGHGRIEVRTAQQNTQLACRMRCRVRAGLEQSGQGAAVWDVGDVGGHMGGSTATPTVIADPGVSDAARVGSELGPGSPPGAVASLLPSAGYVDGHDARSADAGGDGEQHGPGTEGARDSHCDADESGYASWRGHRHYRDSAYPDDAVLPFVGHIFFS